MLGRSFKIVAPRRFEIYVEDIVPRENEAVIQVENAAVCKADIRYYLGNRDEKVLSLKYPMNLLHESVGVVLLDSTGTFKPGQRVVPVPNLILNCDKNSCTHRVCNKAELGENYCPDAYFASSNYNGFSRQFLSYPVSNLVAVPEDVDTKVAVFAELISVAHAIIRRVNLEDSECIAIWGDGTLGYILAATLRKRFKGKIYSVGKNIDKLQVFPVDGYFLKESQEIRSLGIDTAFECVGGAGAEPAIDEIIESLLPGGKLVLSGVSDSNIQINTRRILEKGLEIYGVTRSNVEDFRSSVKDLQDSAFRERIGRLILNEYEIQSINDFYDLFELEVTNRSLGKNLIKFVL